MSLKITDVLYPLLVRTGYFTAPFHRRELRFRNVAPTGVFKAGKQVSEKPHFTDDRLARFDNPSGRGMVAVEQEAASRQLACAEIIRLVRCGRREEIPVK